MLEEKAEKRVRRANLADVAQRAKVSPSAVSRTFTPGASVSKKTRQRVMKAAQELGFQPNVLARSLMTGRSALIALVTNAFANPFINSVIDVFTSELQARNLRPLVFNLKASFDWNQMVNLMLQYQIDGVLVATSTIDEGFLDRVLGAKIPAVQAFGRYLGTGDMDSVFVDNLAGGRIAAQELLARGYRRPGFIGVADSVSTTRDRLTGFREVLSVHGIEPPVVRAPRYAYAAGRDCAKELFGATPELDSVFCADDLLGLGAMDTLRFELGRTVPDTGVIGFNDIDAASWPSHPLATFGAHTGQVVVNAIDLLEARIAEGPKPSEQRIVSCRFVARSSIRDRAN